jgi:hypothetical protein
MLWSRFSAAERWPAILPDIPVPPSAPHNIGILQYHLLQTGGRPYSLTFLYPPLHHTISVLCNITFNRQVAGRTAWYYCTPLWTSKYRLFAVSLPSDRWPAVLPDISVPPLHHTISVYSRSPSTNRWSAVQPDISVPPLHHTISVNCSITFNKQVAGRTMWNNLSRCLYLTILLYYTVYRVPTVCSCSHSWSLEWVTSTYSTWTLYCLRLYIQQAISTG